jgi:hypothetical protein
LEAFGLIQIFCHVLNVAMVSPAKLEDCMSFMVRKVKKKLKITKQLFGQWEDSIEVTSKLDALAQRIRSYLYEA